jgi:PAS domain S-box-containing protein
VKKNRPYFYLLVISAIGIIAITFGTYHHIKSRTAQVKKDMQEELRAITNSKAKQIEEWRADRIGSAETVINNPIWIDVVKQVVGDPDKTPGIKADILRWMEAKRRGGRYGNVLLIRPDGTVALTLNPGDDTVDKALRDNIEESAARKTIVMSDLHFDPKKFIHMDIIIPIIDRKDPTAPAAGFFWFHVDPNNFLYPSLTSWPIPSPTAETFLVRREGGNIVFLKELRHKKEATLLFKIPVAIKDVPMAMVVQGKEGLAEGVDYRGKEVLAFIKKVAGSSWYIIAEIDQQKVYSPIRQEVLRITAFASLLMAFFILSMGLLLIMEGARFTKMRLDEELKRKAVDAHYSYLTKYANDFIILLDEGLHFLEVNDRVVDMYGYTHEELIGMHASQLRAPETRHNFAEQIKVAQRKNGAIFETIHMRKDGTKFPVEISLRSIDTKGKRFYQAIIRDITERKKAEEELRKTEEKYRTIVENINEIIFNIDPQGNITFVSPQCSIVGYSPEEVLGRNILEFAHEDDVERLRGEFIRAVVGGEEFATAFRLKRKGGGYMYVEEINKTIRKDGNIVSMTGVIRGMTERMKAEEVIRASERDWIATFDAMAEGVSIHSLSYEILDANSALCKLLGKPKEEIVGKKCYHLFHGKDGAVPTCPLECSRLSGKREHAELFEPYLGKWLSVSASPVYDEKGAVTKIVHVVSDITNRKNMEKALEENERKLRAIFDQTFQFIGLMTPDGTLIDANRAALELTGIPPVDILGKPFWETPWWTHSQEMQDRLRRAIKDAAGGEFVRFEATHLDREGDTHYVDFSLKPVKDDSGKVIYLIPEGRDITERKKSENALKLAFTGLRETQMELIQSEKLAALGRFAAGIAHEVKNPMGIVLGGAEYLERKLVSADDDVKTAISKIKDAVIRGNLILQSLLVYAQPSTLKYEKLDPVILINDIISIMKYKDIFDKIKCETDFSGEDMSIEADKNQLHQVLFNVMRNAGEAMPNGGVMAIKTYRMKDDELLPGKDICVIEVDDTGMGISHDILHKVTEPFFTTKERKVGTGLGLFITKNIIEIHKGKLVIESEEGKGTKVKILLPCNQANEKEARQ